MAKAEPTGFNEREVLTSRADQDALAFMAIHVLTAAERLAKRVAAAGVRSSLADARYSDDLLRDMYAVYRRYQTASDGILVRARKHRDKGFKAALDAAVEEAGGVDAIMKPPRQNRRARIVELQQKLEESRPFENVSEAARICMACATECFAELLVAPLDQQKVIIVAASILGKRSSTARAAVEIAIIVGALPEPPLGEYAVTVAEHVKAVFGRKSRRGKRCRLRAEVRRRDPTIAT